MTSKRLGFFTGSVELGDKISTLKTPPKVCQHWLSGNCVKGDNCQFIHSWFCGNGISMLAKLWHKKYACDHGIALPLGSDKLYSGSRDGIVRLWDCHTGQCAGVINLGDEVGCLICEGPWVFIGMPNAVKAWNIESSAEFSLNEPVGQVYCMVIANEMLFAGAQDGGILAWKGSPGSENPFHLAGSLRGHSHVVTCLTVGGKMLYSGSMDNTIRVWDVDTLQSVMTLDGHTDAPMSLLCWDQYLLSCSLDRTIKVWVAAEGGNLEVTYTHNEEHGVLVLSGMNDADGQPVLLCACNDNSTRLYELPSFTERGRIFSKREVREIQIGPDGLFFTGDGTGMLSVWKLLAKSSGVAERL
ncbi:zinc finger CCCH domain-containing protein 48-like [Pistacia vera]|uniref:zinc finger CCCH domain-containing protein 48-like n=1 Tax=Pistacia vera TaxID=55513 RepID=UPI001263DB1C|nr:zinc finger CCCH domain-containing protein 48-like [Pistacia vera]